MMDTCVERQTCRICGSDELRPVIDLGNQYIASAFVGDEVAPILQQQYPLAVVRCAAPHGCGLVQLRHSVSPRVLYDHYGYLSGINERMKANLQEIAWSVERLVAAKKGDIALDIGCNDGTLLDAYRTQGLDRLGFDPAPNVAEIARQRGLDVVNDFFSQATFGRTRPGSKARIVTSIAMFYDLESPPAFVRDVASILADDGVWVIELSYMPFMLQRTSFDTVCHEHLEYYSLQAIEWMLARHHMRIHRVEFNDMNGGSFRLYIRKDAAGAIPTDTQVALDKVRQDEDALGLRTDLPYQRFREASQKVRSDLGALLRELKSDGKNVYAYGASTKGNTLLQYCGIDHMLVGKAADRNPDKWGKRTLGSAIPIISEEQARREHPDYFLVLPWHFLDGFIRREAAFLERGGRFIVPLPEVRVVGKGGAV